MNEWKWPFVAVILIVVTANVILFGLADEPVIRERLISNFDTIVTFVFGATAGGALGGFVGFTKGRKEGQRNLAG